MSIKMTRPALLGGTPVAAAAWPPASPSAERYVVEALRGGQLCGYAGNDAPHRTKFEQVSAASRGWRYGIAVTNGTDAIAIAIAAELIKRGRDWCKGRTTILAPTFTWVPGTLFGARDGVLRTLERAPRFVTFDARAEDWTVDELALTAWLEQHADEALFVVVPSLLDTFPQLDTIIAVANRLGVPVLHDGAQTTGSIWRGLKPTCETLSAQLGKLGGIRVGDGGGFFTDDVEVATIGRRLTDCWTPTSGPLNPGGLLDGIGQQLAGNSRMSGLIGAAALGSHEDVMPLIPTIRAVRRAIGTEIVDSSGFVVFRTPPIQDTWSEGPTYGFGMEPTDAALEHYGLNADQWREVFAAEGFANDKRGYKFGLRRPYGPAHTDAAWSRVIELAYPERGTPNADRIAERGLMWHVGHLLNPDTPELIARAVARVEGHLGAVRQHFGLAS